MKKNSIHMWGTQSDNDDA